MDVYGGCGDKCPQSPDPEFCGKDIGQYMFYLAFENSFCPHYVTEKLFKTYEADKITVIPVVRGFVDYDQLAPSGTYVNTAHFATPEELGEHLVELMADQEQLTRILHRRAHFR